MGNIDYLQMHGISKSFGGIQALHQVNFSAASGDVMRLSGKMGREINADEYSCRSLIAGHRRNLDCWETSEMTTPSSGFRPGIRTVYQSLAYIPFDGD